MYSLTSLGMSDDILPANLSTRKKDPGHRREATHAAVRRDGNLLADPRNSTQLFARTMDSDRYTTQL